MGQGVFITLEGGEGAGKSTQAAKLAGYIREKGHEVVVTREVGGCPSAEDIRALWLGESEGYWDALTEVVLINAARREHLVKVIWPALEKGAWVISDRFVDSTRAYQGIGLKLGLATINQFYGLVGGAFEPDLTLLLDLPVEVGEARVAARAGPDDRYQRKPTLFHQTLRDAYLELAKIYASRFEIIDANHDADKVSRDLCAVVSRRFFSRGL